MVTSHIAQTFFRTVLCPLQLLDREKQKKKNRHICCKSVNDTNWNLTYKQNWVEQEVPGLRLWNLVNTHSATSVSISFPKKEKHIK